MCKRSSDSCNCSCSSVGSKVALHWTNLFGVWWEKSKKQQCRESNFHHYFSVWDILCNLFQSDIRWVCLTNLKNGSNQGESSSSSKFSRFAVLSVRWKKWQMESNVYCSKPCWEVQGEVVVPVTLVGIGILLLSASQWSLSPPVTILHLMCLLLWKCYILVYVMWCNYLMWY